MLLSLNPQADRTFRGDVDIGLREVNTEHFWGDQVGRLESGEATAGADETGTPAITRAPLATSNVGCHGSVSARVSPRSTDQGVATRSTDQGVVSEPTSDDVRAAAT
jgi:hypothetical protein